MVSVKAFGLFLDYTHQSYLCNFVTISNINALRPTQNDHHLADKVFTFIFLHESLYFDIHFIEFGFLCALEPFSDVLFYWCKYAPQRSDGRETTSLQGTCETSFLILKQPAGLTQIGQFVLPFLPIDISSSMVSRLLKSIKRWSHFDSWPSFTFLLTTFCKLAHISWELHPFTKRIYIFLVLLGGRLSALKKNAPKT